MRFVPVGGAAAVVPFTLAAALLGAAAQAAPAVSLSATTTHPQGATRVSGTGFGANEAVDIYLDQTDTLLEVTNGAGAFGPDKLTLASFAAVGDHWVTAIGRKDGVAAHKKLVVSTAWASHGFDDRGRRRNPYEVILTATNVNRLDLAWSAATGNTILSSPAVAQGAGAYNPFIFVGSFDNHFYAFDSSGALKWSNPLPDQIGSSPAVANGVVYVGCQDKNLYAFKTASGAAAWPAMSTPASHPPP